ncbi:MAG: 3-hydroxyacyl-CoA dehydrogenase NAD-binding domain-containing protein [Xanthobacteraceae bacterium]|nr:3-hydroxyacyl-CoA dehydrogenase NAD-binding domain-containing protein [Xanthobacteraceae bacterium]
MVAAGGPPSRAQVRVAGTAPGGENAAWTTGARQTIQHIGVVGAGTMGNGIAQAFAGKGFAVTMTDVAEAALARGLATIEASLERLVKKDKLAANDKAATLARIKTSMRLADLADADLVIEAATETSSSSSVFSPSSMRRPPGRSSRQTPRSRSRLAGGDQAVRPGDRHALFNPVPVMQLVELIRGLQTSDETYAQVEAASKALGKAPVRVRNSPGFVVNRMLCPMINEAVLALAEGRDRRGDRPRHEARREPSDRAARTLRPDRPGRRARGDERALRGI